jgi:hypothetical protein
MHVIQRWPVDQEMTRTRKDRQLEFAIRPAGAVLFSNDFITIEGIVFILRLESHMGPLDRSYTQSTAIQSYGEEQLRKLVPVMIVPHQGAEKPIPGGLSLQCVSAPIA